MPEVRSVATSIRANIRAGESILVASPTPFKSHELNGPAMATFYVLTVRKERMK